MKRLLLLILLAGCNASAPTPPTAPTLTWTSDGNPGLPVCSETLAACISGYTLSAGTIVVLPQDALSYTLPIGSTGTYSIVVNGFDQNGNPIVSPPATATVK